MQITKTSVELLKTKGLVLTSLAPFYIDIAAVLSLQSPANWNGALGRKGRAVCCVDEGEWHMRQLSWRVKLLPQVWSCLCCCLWGVTDLFQFGIYSLGCGNNYFLKGNWKDTGDSTDIFLFLDSQIPTIPAVHPQISVALHCSVVRCEFQLSWNSQTGSATHLPVSVPVAPGLLGVGWPWVTPGGKGKNIKVKAILVQVFWWVFSTSKCWQWSKFYLIHFRRTKDWSRGELMLGWLTQSSSFSCGLQGLVQFLWYNSCATKGTWHLECISATKAMGWLLQGEWLLVPLETSAAKLCFYIDWLPVVVASSMVLAGRAAVNNGIQTRCPS